MKTIDDVLKDPGDLKEKEKSPAVIILGPRSDSDEAEEMTEFKKKAREKRLCLRCLINSDGKVETELEGEFCPIDGSRWKPTK